MTKISKLMALCGAALLAGLLWESGAMARIIGTNPTGTSADQFCVGGTVAGNTTINATEVCVDSSGNVIPTTTGTQALGTASMEFSTVRTQGMTDSGNLTVNGNTTLGDATADKVTLNASTVVVSAQTNALNISTHSTLGTALLSIDGANLRVGLSTQAPQGHFTVTNSAADVYAVLVSSNDNGSPLFDITSGGRLETSGKAPTIGTCGTSPSIVGTDVAGKATFGTGGITACTVTFSTLGGAWTNAPVCTVTNETDGAQVYSTPTTTALVIKTTGTVNAADVISYICIGRR